MRTHPRLVPAGASLFWAVFLLLTAAGPAWAQVDPNSPWPMFQQNVRHTGQSPLLGPLFPGSATPPAGQVKSWQGFDKIKMFPILDGNGTIYVGLGFSFCAIKPDMTTKWCTRLHADVSASAGARGLDGTIYIGDRDNTLTAFDPNTGVEKWRYNNGHEGDIWSSPAISPTDGTIYFAHDQSFDGLGVFTALNPSGTLKWKYTIGAVVRTAPAIDQNGIIYVVSSDGMLHAFRDDGTYTTRLWKKPVGVLQPGGDPGGSPVIGPDGMIYLGPRKINPVDGAVIWTYPVTGSWGMSALADDGTLYTSTKNGKPKTVYAIKPDGTLKWKYGPFKVEADQTPMPIIGADGVLYVGFDYRVLALNPVDGTVLWSFLAANPIISFPAIGGTATPADGGVAILYVGSQGKKLYAISSDRESTGGGGGGTNTPPAAVAGSDKSVLVGELVNFDASQSSDPNGDPLTYSWDFGDGNSAPGKVVNHTYAAAGDYTATLTVDDGQAISQDSLVVHVTEGGGTSTSFPDSFNRQDSTDLGPGWGEVQGDLQILANQLRNAPVKANHIAIVQGLVPTPNNSASAWFTSVNNNQGPRFGIVLRFQDINNYYLLYRLVGGTSQLRISKVVNGTESILATKPIFNPALNSAFQLRASVSGSTLTVEVGTTKLIVTDTTLVTGGVGILLGTGLGSFSYKADDFQADVLP